MGKTEEVEGKSEILWYDFFPSDLDLVIKFLVQYQFILLSII